MAGLEPQEQQVLNKFLEDAVRREVLPEIQLYVQKGADLNMRVDMKRTSRGSDYMILSPLLHVHATSNFEQYENDKAIFRFFLDQGVSVDCPDARGDTLLMHAVREGNTSVVDYLLRYNADPRRRNLSGLSALDVAELLPKDATRTEIAEKLAKVLPNVGKKQLPQQSILNEALFTAIEDHDLDGVRMAMQKGANINALNSSANTPLMQAAYKQESAALTELLLEYSPNLMLKNNNGKTVYEQVLNYTMRSEDARRRLKNILLAAFPDEGLTPAQVAEKRTLPPRPLTPVISPAKPLPKKLQGGLKL